MNPQKPYEEARARVPALLLDQRPHEVPLCVQEQ